MLTKQYRLQKSKDIEMVFKRGKTLDNKLLFLKLRKNDLGNSRFGFAIGTKISKKAVIRNRLKRQLREIVRKNLSDVKPGFDVIIIAKPEIINKNYQEIKNDLERLLKIL